MTGAKISPDRLTALTERISAEELAAVYAANENVGSVNALGLSTVPASRGIAELYSLLDHYEIERKVPSRGPRKFRKTTTPKAVVDQLKPARPEDNATRAEIELAKALYPLLRPMILQDLQGALKLAEAMA